jgi:hypothetical protein
LRLLWSSMSSFTRLMVILSRIRHAIIILLKVLSILLLLARYILSCPDS